MTSCSYVGSELELFAEARRWKRYVADTVGRFIVGDVLEVGAGLGSTTRALCRGIENSWTCLEPDPGIKRQMADSFQEAPPPVEPIVRAGTLGELDSSLSFDSILYVDVLEHIYDDRRELAVATSRLRRGGHLAIVAPAHRWLFSEFDKAIGHYRRYTLRTLSEAVPSNMAPRALRYLDSLGVALSAANRLLLRSSSPSRRQIEFWDRFVVPLSRRVDPLLGWRVGKSVVGVWQKL